MEYEFYVHGNLMLELVNYAIIFKGLRLRESLKVIKSQKQILKFSFQPKNEQKIFVFQP